ncbi:hypothetical protein F4678DRAFT_151563 [Xylaria arbuscula]|nr:hypothetical protein F4678DRAFT_151563 [Xylaria arbuscula]
MPHGRGPSTGSSAGAGKSAGTKNNSSSVGGKSVLSKVLGSFRRYSHNGGAAANSNKEEDTSWAETYKITHHPDRPRRDKREGLKSRNSADVMGQLHKIWRHNKEMLEEKRRQRRDRERGAAAPAEVVRSSSRDQIQRGDVRGRQSDDRSSNSTDREVKLPNPQPVVAPPFNWKPAPAPLPDFTQYEWRAPRSTYPPSSPSASSGRMTIRVGLEVQNAEGEEEVSAAGFAPGVRRMTSSAEGVVVSYGGYKYAAGNDTLATTTPLSPLGSFTPPTVTVPLRRPVSIPSSASPKGPVHKRQTRSLSQQRMPLANNTMQQDSTPRSKASREKMSLYINTDQDSTPSLVLNSSPVSEQAGPLTPIEDASDDDEDQRFLSAKAARGVKNTCPMPLCGSPLLTTADIKHNLCAECRDELQPRQSIFTSSVLNPFPTLYSPTNAQISSRAPLIPEDHQYDSTAETAEIKLQAAPRTTRYVHGESKRRSANRGSSTRLGGGVRTTEDPTSSPMIRINNSHVISRFNKDRGDFKLQSVPASRRHAHRTREQKLGRRPGDRPTSKQTPANSHREERNQNVSNDSNHIGFQLAGWPQVSTPSQTPRPPSRRPGDAKPREVSGPLLEPKTFHPPTPPARKDRDNPVGHRRTSATRPRANRASSGRRPSSLSKVPIGKTSIPTPGSAPPRSTGQKRNKHHSNPDRLRYRTSEPVGNGTYTRETEIGEKASPKVEKLQAGDDIYREIDSIIDCYLRLPDAPELHNEKRKADAIASYFSAVPLDVEMKIKGFI